MPRKAPSPKRVEPTASRTPAMHKNPRTFLRFLILFVVFLVMVSFACSILQLKIRLFYVEQYLVAQSVQGEGLSQQIDELRHQIDAFTIKPSSSTVAITPDVQNDGNLTRGSVSPDGTMYAGYEDADATQLGVAIETYKNKKISHQVIFQKGHTTGAGTPYEKEMSVRWKGNAYVQFDYLTTVGHTQKKITETVRVK